MKRVVLLAALGAMSWLAHADAPFVARPEVQAYINEQVASGRFTRPELESLFSHIVEQPKILAILDRPATSSPWYQFRSGFFNEGLLDDGVRFWRQHRDALDRAQARYGVPPEVIVAILGIESHYGRRTGHYRVADVLATIGFDYPRRAAYFRGELTEMLLLAHEEHVDPLSLKGSYAGAMGWPQFMPSSYRKWAVDFDASGHRDIWSNADDAIGSVGNYFQQQGWIAGDDVSIPATVTPGPDIDALVADKFELHYTVAQLQSMGVTPQAPLPPGAHALLVPLEVAPGVTQYWVGLTNFYVITRYNKSTQYAQLTEEIAREIKSRYFAAEQGGSLPINSSP